MSNNMGYRCIPHLPAVAGAAVGLPLLLEALRAVDRLVAAWDERHLRLAPARRTDCAVQLTRRAAGVTTVAVALAIAITIARAGAAAAAGFALLAAGRAARGLIGKALLRIELLLASGEDELHPAIPARNDLVCVTHRSHTP